jgi:integrase
VAPDKITVAEFLARFDRDWIATHVSPRSAERYRGALAHLVRHQGSKVLQKLTPADLATFYAALARAGLAPRTIKCVHVVVHRALGMAKLWGIVRDNPAEITKPPKAQQQETAMMQPKEASRLLALLQGKPLYLLASLGLATGMRRNEMLALRWRDIDFEKKQIQIATALEQTKALGIRVKAPKTRHGVRSISIPAHVVTELRQHWKAQQEQRLAMGLGRAGDDDPVLSTADGKFQSPDAVSHAWMRQMESIGMSAVTLHSLRHTHASMLIKSGIDVVTVSRRLGHGSPKVTLEVYGHLVAGTDDRAAEIMGEAFGK